LSELISIKSVTNPSPLKDIFDSIQIQLQTVVYTKEEEYMLQDNRTSLSIKKMSKLGTTLEKLKTTLEEDEFIKNTTI
jgi:hypothetical protein